MSPATAKRRLAGVVPLRFGAQGSPIYAFAEAAPRLCKIEVSDQEFEDRIKRMRPQDLPPMIHAVFWDGQNKKATWEKNAKNLWHTEDVVEVLGETFKIVRQTMQLWADDLRQEKRLTDDQALYLQQQVDALQDDIYHRLVRMAKSRETLPLSETPIDEQRDV
jgi:Mg2+ and Co2+ transporter CorA